MKFFIGSLNDLFGFQVENILAKFGLLATTKAVEGGAKVEDDQPLLDLIHQDRYEDLVSIKNFSLQDGWLEQKLILRADGDSNPQPSDSSAPFIFGFNLWLLTLSFPDIYPS